MRGRLGSCTHGFGGVEGVKREGGGFGSAPGSADRTACMSPAAATGTAWALSA